MQNPPAGTPTPETPEIGKTKKRHGCLTAWLILIIIGSIISIIVYLTRSSFAGSPQYLPGWALPVLVIILVFDIICAIAIFMWKKWGFWGFCAVAVVSLVINILIGLGVASIGGLVGVAILYGVLNIGGNNKGWTQLE